MCSAYGRTLLRAAEEGRSSLICVASEAGRRQIALSWLTGDAESGLQYLSELIKASINDNFGIFLMSASRRIYACSAWRSITPSGTRAFNEVHSFGIETLTPSASVGAAE